MHHSKIDVIYTAHVDTSYYDTRSVWQIVKDAILCRNPEIKGIAKFKFIILPNPAVLPGDLIQTEDGLKWFVTAKSDSSLIVDSIELMSQREVDVVDRHVGITATVLQHALL